MAVPTPADFDRDRSDIQQLLTEPDCRSSNDQTAAAVGRHRPFGAVSCVFAVSITVQPHSRSPCSWGLLRAGHPEHRLAQIGGMHRLGAVWANSHGTGRAQVLIT